MMLLNLRYLRSTEVPTRYLGRFEIFISLQMGDKSDSVSVDRLKAVFSSVPVTPAVPPPRERPRLFPASVTKPPVSVHLKKKVRLETPVPATKLLRNPHQMVQGFWPLSAVLWPHLLGGVTGVHAPVHVKKNKVWFETPVPATKLRCNTHRTV